MARLTEAGVLVPLVAAPDLYARFNLMGDEDCGVALHCRDCWDGGRPLAYYDTNNATPPYRDDELVENVTTISGILTVARRHDREVHG